MLAAVALSALLAATPASPEGGAASQAGGSIAGKVLLAGVAPKLPPVPISRDPKYCGLTKEDESLLIGAGGGVRNAVVWLADGPAASKPDEKVRLDQQGCRFTPHVLAVSAGTVLEVATSDPVFHNVRASPGPGEPPGHEGSRSARHAGERNHESVAFNYAMPIQGYVVPTKLKRPGLFHVVCDVHPWMKGYLYVLETSAHAVTGADGSFTLSGVPPGKYHLKVWHERLGEQDATVEVQAGGTTQRDIQMQAR